MKCKFWLVKLKKMLPGILLYVVWHCLLHTSKERNKECFGCWGWVRCVTQRREDSDSTFSGWELLDMQTALRCMVNGGRLKAGLSYSWRILKNSIMLMYLLARRGRGSTDSMCTSNYFQATSNSRVSQQKQKVWHTDVLLSFSWLQIRLFFLLLHVRYYFLFICFHCPSSCFMFPKLYHFDLWSILLHSPFFAMKSWNVSFDLSNWRKCCQVFCCM